MKKKFILILFSIALLALNSALFSDDIDLFSVKVPPNVIIQMDNSGSMNTIIFHPNYDPEYDYQGYIYYAPTTLSSTKTITRYVDDDGMVAYTYNNWKVDRVVTVTLYGTLDYGNSVRYDYNYLQWLFFYATPQEIAEVSWFSTHGTFDLSDTNVYDDRYTRIQVERSALSEVVQEVFNLEEFEGLKMEFYKFQEGADPVGGIRMVPSHSWGWTAAELNNILAHLRALPANTWTPLAESISTIYTEFFRECLTGTGANSSVQRTCPVEHWCQKQFIIVMTDGQSSRDDFDNFNWYNAHEHLNQDWDADDRDPRIDDENYCPLDTCWISDAEGTDYLDDVAYYLAHYDIFPDDPYANLSDQEYGTSEKRFKNTQNIYTYAIGFTIDNDLLKATAENGGGEYYTANNYDELVDALMKALYSILQRSYAFASFAAPKKSYTFEDENIGIVAYFVPKVLEGIWEGHLEAYKLDENGYFHLTTDQDGNVIFDPEYEIWDAHDTLNNMSPSERTIRAYTGSTTLTDFTEDNWAVLQGFLDTSSEDETKEVIRYVRGDNGLDHKLGDIFHSSPVIVTSPFKWKTYFDEDYEEFYNNYKDREEIVIVGANDGMLHFFRLEDGKELFALIPDEVLPNLKEMALDSDHIYGVDGSPTVEDIYYYDSSNKKTWRTIVVFGLRQGGEAYYAMDVSDTENPVFLWKFGSNVSEAQDYIAETWGTPIIGKIKYKTGGVVKDKWVVFLSAGYDEDYDSTSKKGKALFIVDAWTGDIIKMFAYDPSTSSNSETAYYTDDENFSYPIVGEPLVIDTNYDGYMDYIYVGNIGGNIYKIDLTNPDRTEWEPVLFFDGEDDQPIFISPTAAYDTSYNLWVFFGTGDRANITDDDSTGMIVGVIDKNDNHTTDLSELTELVNPLIYNSAEDQYEFAEQTIPETSRGFYRRFDIEGEKLIEPKPLVITDKEDNIPTLIFTTTAPPEDTDDPCEVINNMHLWMIKVNGNVISGSKEGGRVAGGGLVGSNEYVIYQAEGETGSISLKDQKTFDIPFAGGMIFWKERRR